MGGFLVPVIAVFTKYDQFRRDIKIKLEDEGRDSEMNIDDEVENLFHQHFLASLRETPPYVRLESENLVINHRVLPNCCPCRNAHPSTTMYQSYRNYCQCALRRRRWRHAFSCAEG